MDANPLDTARDFLKDNVRRQVDFSRTDQNLGVPAPPLQKPYPPEALRIDLPRCDEPGRIGSMPIGTAIKNRESRRHYSTEPLTLEELSFLLWATQGIRIREDRGYALRTVPSAGCRHAFETYLCILNINGLTTGIYRYLPVEHQLLFISGVERLQLRIGRALLGQSWAGQAAVLFAWAAIPYRMEWRYSMASHKVIALDAGHVCQNLYLACEAIGAGTCAIAAYDQEEMDSLLMLDGTDEFTIYLAPVGKNP
jgi:SagB-type dehydrogenase family enzyme